ncbi:uncharacterized protein LOC128220349 isoform X2 [Mya arenaria]|uniref:uncharacterized protein LOC128220349 isoform X2 n=1 Tax=Mya arenaria TaxID=6604 RepID=UPI0022E42398|nr:uncharacterized protein LOC128220349 isoform X2 [Mya arenaria]
MYTVEHTESETVRSTVSTASSGFAIVSAPVKSRKPVIYSREVKEEVYEPPPDYDESPTHSSAAYVDRQQFEKQVVRTPLLSSTNTHGLDGSNQQVDTCECQRPLLNQSVSEVSSAVSRTNRTSIRVSTEGHDLNIEISSPSMSPRSASSDQHFFNTSNNSKDESRCCKRPMICGIVIGMSITLVLLGIALLVVSQTVCVGPFTRACK